MERGRWASIIGGFILNCILKYVWVHFFFLCAFVWDFKGHLYNSNLYNSTCIIATLDGLLFTSALHCACDLPSPGTQFKAWIFVVRLQNEKSLFLFSSLQFYNFSIIGNVLLVKFFSLFIFQNSFCWLLFHSAADLLNFIYWRNS